jgi:hypothetical protein
VEDLGLSTENNDRIANLSGQAVWGTARNEMTSRGLARHRDFLAAGQAGARFQAVLFSADVLRKISACSRMGFSSHFNGYRDADGN